MLINKSKKFLENTLGISISRVPKKESLKEQPVPLVRSTVMRLIYYFQILEKISNTEGDVVECGVGWGRSLFIFLLLAELFPISRDYFGFDSFEGFPEPTHHDQAEKYGIKKGRYSTQENSVRMYLINSGIEQDLLDSKVKLIKGFFSESLKHYKDRKIALLNLDVDLYQSYKETLEYFYPKVVKGGIILFDEYQATEKYPGAKKAIDEYFEDKIEKPIKSDIIDRYYIIKQ